MGSSAVLKYVLQNQIELNFSYMPFIKDGGLFIPTNDKFELGSYVTVDLQLPGYNDAIQFEGKVIWITPNNSLYLIYAGIGVQLIGENAKSIHETIKGHIDNTLDVGGYMYGITATSNV